MNVYQKQAYSIGAGHEHCWHLLSGPIWMVVPDGQVVQKCCHCEARRTIHRDHAK